MRWIAETWPLSSQPQPQYGVHGRHPLSVKECKYSVLRTSRAATLSYGPDGCGNFPDSPNYASNSSENLCVHSMQLLRMGWLGWLGWRQRLPSMLQSILRGFSSIQARGIERGVTKATRDTFCPSSKASLRRRCSRTIVAALRLVSH